MMMNNIEVCASPARRALGIGCLWGLTGLLLLVLSRGGMPAGPVALMLALAVATALLGEKMRRATLIRLRLTDKGIETSDGLLLAPMHEIERVERGVFAFKPSNGFLLKLSGRGPACWAPGLYWRRGRRLGVGGVTAAASAKAMAEAIAMRIAARD